jgi:endoglucanase
LSSTGAVLANINVPNTGGYQVWQTVTAIVTLPAGAQTLRLQSTATPIWNINWLQFDTYTPPPPPSNPGVATIPGKIESESYSNMSGVATESSTDGTLDVGWIDRNDWMDYNVNVTTGGQYTASFRIATPNSNAVFQLLTSGGTVLATISVPNTGGYQVWQTITATVNLPAGAQTLRIASIANDGWNINWMQFDAIAPPVSSGNSIPGKIEAESYSNMSGVATESCSEGTLDVGWIDRNDWMDYNVNVTATGQYTASFRVATPNNNAVFQLITSGGTVLATVGLPNTGGYQNWQTVTVSVNLPAGPQTLRIASIANDGWNINWMQFSVPGSSQAIGTTGQAQSAAAALLAGDDIAQGTTLFPNPVKDVFTIRMNNNLAGKMLVQITDASGKVMQVNSFVKEPGLSQVTINTAGLSTGIYFVRILVGDQSEVKKIFRL